MVLISARRNQLIGLLLLIGIFATACGAGGSPPPTEAPPESASTDPPLPPTDTPAPSATDIPAPNPIIAPNSVVYTDPEGDCLNDDNLPTACTPPGVDILSVSITSESPLTIVIELAADGFDGFSEDGSIGVVIGIDLDRDMSTGFTSFWPEFHALGPDVEIRWSDRGGFVNQDIRLYAPDGTRSNGDATLAVWTFPDANHVQVVISSELVDSPSIGISGDVFTEGLYDHFVDDGHLTFPEGEVNLVN